MEVLRIVGGKKISGVVTVGGAKNAVLPILAATILTDEDIFLEGCPKLLDVNNMLKIMETLGCSYTFEENGKIHIESKNASGWEMPDDLSKALRSSIFMMGPILGRFHRATVTYPGGCEIGQRPIDLHLKGLRTLGVVIEESHGMIYCDGTNLHGGNVHFDFPSVGATENIMMAAVLAKGKTIISNAAREPEIIDLQRFINAMGGEIDGAGTDEIRIRGVEKLHGTRYTPLPDRIVAGTLLAAAAMTHGDIVLRNVMPGDLNAVLDKLTQSGCHIETSADEIKLSAPRTLNAIEVSTQPHPGFPTDMQAQIMAMTCISKGTSVIVENVFENRLSHAAQLRRMGADIIVNNRTAVVRGGKLTGTRVTARDLRGGAALVMAGLAAEGETMVDNIQQIDRGYDKFERTLKNLGADIVRETI